MARILVLSFLLSGWLSMGSAFLTSPRAQACFMTPTTYQTTDTLLSATGGKKKRRRRKKPPVAPGSVEEGPTAPSADSMVDENMDELDDEEVNVDDILDVAKFEFDGAIATDSDADEQASQVSEGNAIPLPDIREALQKKKMEEEQARIEEEEAETKVKIKRSDKTALAKLLEQQPYADADDSFFEEEEYNTVSALLGERAKPFLGIPTGPLQVGHFIGALVIILMAFVEYPGFPLTNLPTPLRGALQGGLGTVYLTNTILAVLAVFKAGERGQPAPLWVAKTFTVGGLAFDQLTQLPTLEQIERAKSRKGKRALKNRKK